MAMLKVVSGDEEGRLLRLDGERTVIGRHPNCQVVLDNASVSRHHAQILESHGTFYLEDLRSRNGTFLNGAPLESRTQLSDGDQIRVCDIVLAFQHRHDTASEFISPRLGNAAAESANASRDELLRRTRTATPENDTMRASDDSFRVSDAGDFALNADASSIVSHAGGQLPSDSFRVGLDPELKLKAVLEISQALRSELELDAVLPKILVTLFSIFPQANQGFILLKDPQADKLRVKATRARGGRKPDEVAVSMTVVRQVLESCRAILSRDVQDDTRFKTTTSLTRFDVRSMMCVPLVDASGDALGVIQLNTLKVDKGFSEDDLDLLVSVAAQAELAVENARLHEAALRQREMERDLDFATQVQLGFLPKERPKVPGYAFADYYEAALRVGGDYFDYIVMPDGRLAIALGDVAGKGMPAALLMARLYSSTRFQLFTAETPAEALAGLNKDIAGSGLGHRFITFVLMVLDPPSGQVTIVNAGHLAPLLRRTDGQVEAVCKKESGLPLGIIPDQQYESAAITLQEGETLLAFTDGVTEAMNESRVIYGRDRLMACVAASSGGIVSQIKSIISDVESFGASVQSRDDTCCVGVERVRAPEQGTPASSP
ncbi:MAG: SpoIIE family protein phosphatase [Planctomycetaceae bacterium]|nr:SpoIIE family protein phosphatase [Planctomycetaceae bacterium]